ncbi:MAG: histidine kinase [Cyclobacteriaceae bacterium]|nr:histidine kinase [Cyclobacteriaceae bacterium]
MKRPFFHNPLYRLLGPVTIGLMVYLLILLLNNNVSQINTLFTSEEVYLCIGLGLLFTESFRLITLVNKKIDKKLGSISPLFVQFILSSIVTILLISGGVSVYYNYNIGYAPSNIEYQIFNGIFIFLNLLLNLIYLSIYYSGKENNLKIDKEREKNEGMELELLDYKRDINSTLLYQSLEKLIVLVHEDTNKAEELIDDLSSVYRYILGNKQMELVQVGTELNVVNRLLHLLNEIHLGSISINHQPDELINSQVVPGTILGIIEQIVKSTIITSSAPLVISILRGNDGYLEIKHRLRDRLVREKEEEKLLIETIQRAYNYFSDKPIVRVKAFEESFYKIPVLAFAEEEVLIG